MVSFEILVNFVQKKKIVFTKELRVEFHIFVIAPQIRLLLSIYFIFMSDSSGNLFLYNYFGFQFWLMNQNEKNIFEREAKDRLEKNLR